MHIALAALRIALVAAIGALPAYAETHPNFSGTWKLQPTGIDPRIGPADVVFVIDHKDPRCKYTAKGTSGQKPFEESYEFTTRGEGPLDPARLSIIGAWQGDALVLKYVKDGKELATFQLRLSADGKQMTRRGEFATRKVAEVYIRQ